MLPFTHARFLEVFASYNAAVWPGQVVAYLLAAAMLTALAAKRPGLPGQVIGVGLGAMWLWTGVAYHWLQFATINKAAWAFGTLFVLQGLLLLVAAARGTLSFDATAHGISKWLGWGLIGYATVLYPLLGTMFGPGYPQVPMFGITPCPVTLFTFGLLLLARPPVARWLLVIPVLWSLVGGSAAFLLQVPQDWVLLLSGLSVILLVRRHTPVLVPQGQH